MKHLFRVFLAIGLGSCFKVLENPALFEGDMKLTPDQIREIKYGRDAGYAATTSRWPSRVIAWDATKEMSSSKRAMGAIKGAMAEYEAKTCLKFVRRTNEKHYLKFYKGDGCESPVGYNGKVNNIGLAWECQNVKTVLHEMFHSLGFYHEQSRPDRDKFVRIIWKNIPIGHRHNFAKHSYSVIDSMGEQYDYASISHYRKDLFGFNGAITIETLDEKYQDVIGNGTNLSVSDVKQLNKLYRCYGKGTQPPTLTPPTPRPPVCEDEKGEPYCKGLISYCKRSGNLGDVLKRHCYKSCGYC